MPRAGSLVSPFASSASARRSSERKRGALAHASEGRPPVEGALHEVRVAGLIRRFGTSLVDAILLSPVVIACTWLTLHVTGTSLLTRSELGLNLLVEIMLSHRTILLGIILLLCTLAAVYTQIFVCLRGFTPGQRALGCRVITLYGERPGWARIAIRSVFATIGLLTFGLGLIWIGFDREKRGLHDWVAGTYVIRKV